MAGGARRRGPALVAALSIAASVGWLVACGDDGSSSPPVELSEAGERGAQVVEEQGCTNCHSTDGSRGTGPTWRDLAGSEVELDDGTVTADDEYLRTSILDPRAQVVKNFPNIMPVYEGQLSDDELDDVIAYLRDLSTITASSGDGSGDGEGQGG